MTEGRSGLVMKIIIGLAKDRHTRKNLQETVSKNRLTVHADVFYIHWLFTYFVSSCLQFTQSTHTVNTKSVQIALAHL